MEEMREIVGIPTTSKVARVETGVSRISSPTESISMRKKIDKTRDKDSAAKFIIGTGMLIAVFVMVFPAVLVAGTIHLPKTGETTCYDTSGTFIDGAGSGQDGEIQAGIAWPDPRFTDHSDGTVKDNLTGLDWMQNPTVLATMGRQESLDIFFLQFPKALINALASVIDDSISLMSEATSDSMDRNSFCRDAIARALRLCFKNNT